MDTKGALEDMLRNRAAEIAMLNDTLSICKAGKFNKDGQKHVLKTTDVSDMLSARVFLPEEIHKLAEFKDFEHIFTLGRCGFECKKQDSFTLACELDKQKSLFLYREKKQEILVLNFANPTSPGGGVRQGACAQEEDLCRRSSLLLSLEGPSAREYYEYNRALHTNMGSDAIIISPTVEIIKDANGELLNDTVVVAVMTCAAPMILDGLEGLTQKQYESLLYNRVC